MHKTITLAALAALLLATAPGMVAAKSPVEKKTPTERQCFWASSVNGFAAADENTVNLRVGVRDVYQLEMQGRCPDVDWSHKIGILSRGSSFICSGMDAELITPTTNGPMRCMVRTVRKLTPDEVAALPKRGRP